jgi:secreted PhoX family phosphatase
MRSVLCTLSLLLLGGCDRHRPAGADLVPPVAPTGAGLERGGPPALGASAEPKLRIDSVALPAGVEVHALQVARAARMGEQRWPVGFSTILRAGDAPGAEGTLIDHLGRPLPSVGRCASLDFAGLLPSPSGMVFASHLECHPGAILLTPVVQTGVGALGPGGPPRPIDMSGVGGLGLPCAGGVTPWGTLLSSEEFEVDARVVDAAGRDPGDHAGWNHQIAYWAGSQAPQPYAIGFIPEVGPLGPLSAGQGPLKVPVVKHYAMGRLSHEVALLLPDERTVYLSDDGDNGVLTVFVADKARDLSAGTLYAARFAGAEGALGAIEWVSLGHASDAEIGAKMSPPPAFSALLRRAELRPPGLCPSGLSAVNTAWGPECLAVQPGAEALASRLETRRVAAIRGATTEINKAEGLTFDARRGEVLLAISRIGGGMEAKHPKWDVGGPDHLRLDGNDCGGVMALHVAAGQRDTDGQPIDSAYMATTARWLLQGRLSGADPKNVCDPEGLANPDNLGIAPDADLLFIAEDTDRHEVAALWAYDLGSGALSRIATSPTGAELAGLQLVAGPDGRDYLTLSVQFHGGPGEVSSAGLLGPLSPPPR